MRRQLVVEVARSQFATIAAAIARKSDGVLELARLRDPVIGRQVRAARPDWRGEPALLEIDGEMTRVFTGVALRSRLVQVLGPRRAWGIAQQLATSGAAPFVFDPNRRAVLRGGAGIAAGVIGLMAIGPAVVVEAESAAAANEVDPSDIDPEGKNRPGKYSRREGIERWKVDWTGSTADVSFKHEKRRLSGEARISYGGHSSTTIILTRDNDRYQLAYNGEGRLAGTDNRGRAFSARWNRDRGRWDTDNDSEQIARQSRADFRLGIAIMLDLADDSRSRNSVVLENQNADAMALASCPSSCCQDYDRQEGNNGMWPSRDRVIACDEALTNVNRACTDYSQTCTGCCRMLEGCACICDPFFGSDAWCLCSMYGYPYQPYCRS